VLNMHYYETPGLFESVRVSYLLANGACVVSEVGIGQEGYSRACAAVVGYEELVETCVHYAKDDRLRDVSARYGAQIFQTLFDEKSILERALSEIEKPKAKPQAKKPTLCLIIIGADTEAFEKCDFLQIAQQEADELVLIKTKDGRFGGQGAIFNRVLDRTTCDVVGMVHADTTFAKGSLEIFARTAFSGKVTGLVGRALDKRYVWSKEVKVETAVSTLDGCSIFLPRSRLFENGCFDSKTFDSFHCGVEDVCLYAQYVHVPVVVPSAIADHHSEKNGTYLQPEWQKAYWSYREKLVKKWAGVDFETT